MAGKRQLVSSGGPFERKYGYSRAVRVGSRVFVAGTAAFKDGVPFAPGDAGAQTRHILEVIARALEETLRQTRPGRQQIVLFLTDGLPTEGEMIGLVVLYRKGEQPFLNEDLALAELLAPPTALAVRRND